MKPSITIGYSLLVRTLLPGIVIAILSLPVVAFGAILISDVLYKLLAGNILIYLSVATIGFGFTATFLDNYIYKVYEGYLLWPKWLLEIRTSCLDRKVRKETARAEALREEKPRECDKIWYWLRDFPLINDGDPGAVAPTKLGNIIYEYEEYPLSRYNMDPAFYWSRMWFIADENARKTFSSAESEASGIIYITFATFMLTGIYLVLTILQHTINLPAFYQVGSLEMRFLQKYTLFLLFSGFVSWLTYIMALVLHRRSGDLYKALFDVHRNKVSEVLGAIPIEKEHRKWDSYWMYLNYLSVRCAKCGRVFYYEQEVCPYCESTKYGRMKDEARLFWKNVKEQEMNKIKSKLLSQ
jgi:hypothetical protein